MRIKQRFVIKPKTLFLIDSLGALLTAFFLFVVLRRFEVYFGMPEEILLWLSTIAIIFCVYSFACFIFLKEKWKLYLGIVAVANLLYCCLTLTLVIYNLEVLTFLGITYFVLEIVLIVTLVFIEIKLLRIKTNQPE